MAWTGLAVHKPACLGVAWFGLSLFGQAMLSQAKPNQAKPWQHYKARPTAGFPIRDLKTTRQACQHRERRDKSRALYLSVMRMLLALANLCSRLTASGDHAKKVCDSARNNVSILSKLSSTLVLTCD